MLSSLTSGVSHVFRVQPNTPATEVPRYLRATQLVGWSPDCPYFLIAALRPVRCPVPPHGGLHLTLVDHSGESSYRHGVLMRECRESICGCSLKLPPFSVWVLFSLRRLSYERHEFFFRILYR